MGMDAARKLILDRIADLETDLKTASLAMKRNHAYLHQFIHRGVPADLKESDRKRLAAFLKVDDELLRAVPIDLDSMDVAHLTDAARPNGPRMLPVLGYVGAGAEVHMVDDNVKGQGIDDIEAPPGASARAVAVRVRGDSMLPAYHDGDHIVYDEQRRGDDLARYIGRECVVRLQDGRTFIKTIGRGAVPGTWTLWSYNAAPMQDVLVEWAARVKWIERAG